MRARFLTILLLFSPLVAHAVDCSSLTLQQCEDSAGCYVETFLGVQECLDCTGYNEDIDTGHYCINGNQYKCNDTDSTDDPGEDFKYSDSNAKSKYECYKKLDGQSGNGHGEQCTERDGSAVTCRQYYRDSNSANNHYVSQQNGSTYYYIVCEDEDHNSSALTETVGYIGEDTKCIDLHNNADLTLYQYYCEKAYSAPLNSTNSPTVMRYHIETDGKCYSNALTCGKFGATGGCASANTNDISFSGYLRWNWNNKQWQQDTNATAFTCKCTKNNIDIEVSGNDYTCTGNADYTANGTVYNPNTVDETSVAYNDYPVGYSCESCKAGYVGFVRRAGNTQMKTCFPAMNGCFSSGCGTGYAYGCFDAPYNFDNNNGFRCLKVGDYSDLSFEDFYKPCYAGMTTDDTGSTTRNDCHYTNDTNFCDAYGCVSMDQLLQNTGTSQNDWTWYMQ